MSRLDGWMALLRDSLGFLLGPGSQEARALLLQKANVQVILTMPLKPGLGLGSLATSRHRNRLKDQGAEKPVRPQHVHGQGVAVDRGQGLGLRTPSAPSLLGRCCLSGSVPSMPESVLKASASFPSSCQILK